MYIGYHALGTHLLKSMSGRKDDYVGMSQKQLRLNSLTGLSVWLLGCSRMCYIAFTAAVLVEADHYNNDDDGGGGRM